MQGNFLEENYGRMDPDSFNLLLGHNPEYFRQYAQWGADLVLAGHNHGGLWRLPGLGGVIAPGMLFFPKYDAGVFHEKNATMVVSRGLGSHAVYRRINNRPELNILTLECGKGTAGKK